MTSSVVERTSTETSESVAAHDEPGNTIRQRSVVITKRAPPTMFDWFRRLKLRYEVESSLYMLDGWEKVIINTLFVAAFVGAAYTAITIVRFLIK